MHIKNPIKGLIRLVSVIVIITHLSAGVGAGIGWAGPDKLGPVSRWDSYFRKHNLSRENLLPFVAAVELIQQIIDAYPDQSEQNSKLMELVTRLNSLDFQRLNMKIIKPDNAEVPVFCGIDMEGHIVRIPYIVFSFNGNEHNVFFNLDHTRLSLSSLSALGIAEKDKRLLQVPGTEKNWIEKDVHRGTLGNYPVGPVDVFTHLKDALRGVADFGEVLVRISGLKGQLPLPYEIHINEEFQEVYLVNPDHFIKLAVCAGFPANSLALKAEQINDNLHIQLFAKVVPPAEVPPQIKESGPGKPRVIRVSAGAEIEAKRREPSILNYQKLLEGLPEPLACWFFSFINISQVSPYEWTESSFNQPGLTLEQKRKGIARLYEIYRTVGAETFQVLCKKIGLDSLSYVRYFTQTQEVSMGPFSLGHYPPYIASSFSGVGDVTVARPNYVLQIVKQREGPPAIEPDKWEFLKRLFDEFRDKNGKFLRGINTFKDTKDFRDLDTLTQKMLGYFEQSFPDDSQILQLRESYSRIRDSISREMTGPTFTDTGRGLIIRLQDGIREPGELETLNGFVHYLHLRFRANYLNTFRTGSKEGVPNMFLITFSNSGDISGPVSGAFFTDLRLHREGPDYMSDFIHEFEIQGQSDYVARREISITEHEIYITALRGGHRPELYVNFQPPDQGGEIRFVWNDKPGRRIQLVESIFNRIPGFVCRRNGVFVEASATVETGLTSISQIREYASLLMNLFTILQDIDYGLNKLYGKDQGGFCETEVIPRFAEHFIRMGQPGYGEILYVGPGEEFAESVYSDKNGINRLWPSAEPYKDRLMAWMDDNECPLKDAMSRELQRLRLFSLREDLPIGSVFIRNQFVRKIRDGLRNKELILTSDGKRGVINPYVERAHSITALASYIVDIDNLNTAIRMGQLAEKYLNYGTYFDIGNIGNYMIRKYRIPLINGEEISFYLFINPQEQIDLCYCFRGGHIYQSSRQGSAGVINQIDNVGTVEELLKQSYYPATVSSPRDYDADTIKTNLLAPVQEDIRFGTVIPGIPVYGQPASGCCEILNDPIKESTERFKDKIIITSHPSPELVPFLRAAKGIIFCGGSPICHGSILAREYKCPSIIIPEASITVEPSGAKKFNCPVVTYHDSKRGKIGNFDTRYFIDIINATAYIQSGDHVLIDPQYRRVLYLAEQGPVKEYLYKRDSAISSINDINILKYILYNELEIKSKPDKNIVKALLNHPLYKEQLNDLIRIIINRTLSDIHFSVKQLEERLPLVQYPQELSAYILSIQQGMEALKSIQDEVIPLSPQPHLLVSDVESAMLSAKRVYSRVFKWIRSKQEKVQRLMDKLVESLDGEISIADYFEYLRTQGPIYEGCNTDGWYRLMDTWIERAKTDELYFFKLQVIRAILRQAEILGLDTKRLNEHYESALRNKKKDIEDKYRAPVIWLAKPNEPEFLTPIDSDFRDLVGGKAASLGTMLKQSSLPTEPAFVITTEGFGQFASQTEYQGQSLDDFIQNKLQEPSLTFTDRARIIQEAIMSAEIPALLRKEIIDCFGYFQGVPVSVRSSCNIEDEANYAFAGQFLTVLNVKTEEQLIENIKCVWASTWGENVLKYMADRGISFEKASMAVIVQRMSPIEKSGIAFSIDTSAQDYEVSAADVVFGLGEGIVEGTVPSDNYKYNKRTRRISEVVRGKDTMIVPKEDGVGTKIIPVPRDRQLASVLNVYEREELFSMVQLIEIMWGYSVDIEFAITHDGRINIMQVRPITTTSIPFKVKLREGYLEISHPSLKSRINERDYSLDPDEIHERAI